MLAVCLACRGWLVVSPNGKGGCLAVWLVEGGWLLVLMAEGGWLAGLRIEGGCISLLG